ncbi:type II toxin-antitoxin system RelE/ParE family toxin [Hymenobacter baengnokdamensis]|uniref:type II toxin-antitoxin system RelE/ParE family toxin n=1 Tax=Hymenobacter baengnokdamensis TaxID=2615203 RepID=UPI001245D384|nr:type II toxin-antitoxin system RelE/ParE family toxin [Hymenobacter baengnokdamensis]
MSFEIISSIRFDRFIKRLAKKYVSMPDDFARLLVELRNNPQTGEPLGRDCYKVRMSIAAKNKGKSGGARVITCVKIVGETVFLLTIYDKSEQESISDSERDELLRENGLL